MRYWYHSLISTLQFCFCKQFVFDNGLISYRPLKILFDGLFLRILLFVACFPFEVTALICFGVPSVCLGLICQGVQFHIFISIQSQLAQSDY